MTTYKGIPRTGPEGYEGLKIHKELVKVRDALEELYDAIGKGRKEWGLHDSILKREFESLWNAYQDLALHPDVTLHPDVHVDTPLEGGQTARHVVPLKKGTLQ